ncbi:MAG: hypothetical protein ABJA10_07615 [Aestuariivirga sp.]
MKAHEQKEVTALAQEMLAKVPKPEGRSDAEWHALVYKIILSEVRANADVKG